MAEMLPLPALHASHGGCWLRDGQGQTRAVGKGDAIVAAGRAVSRDVADGELRMVRAEQLVKPGWADRFHDAMRKKKEGK